MGGSTEAFGLVLAALGEELVYRLAVLIVVGVVCAALLGRNWRNAEDWGTGPGVVAIAAAGIVFAFLPGHVAQMSDTFHALPFVSLGIVLGYVVLRTGALLPAALVHALLEPRDDRGRHRPRAGHAAYRAAVRRHCWRSSRAPSSPVGASASSARSRPPTQVDTNARRKHPPLDSRHGG